MTLRGSALALALALALAAPAALAQKLQPVSPLERGADPAAALSADGQTHARSGRPAALTHLDLSVPAASDEAMARAVLAGVGADLGLGVDPTADLEVTETSRGPAGTVVRFRQTVGGVPVWGAETVVGLDPQRRGQSVVSGYRAGLSVASLAPAVAAGDARADVLAHLGATGELRVDRTELMVWPADGGARLAWVVRVTPTAPLGDWEGVVDARTGELLRVADRATYHRRPDGPPTALPTVETHPLFMADGAAYAFVPDPLTRAGVTYGTPGYVDGNDATTPELDAARTEVVLRDLTYTDGRYRLVGPWAEIREIESPSTGLFDQDSDSWKVTRDQQAFEAVNAYYHIDTYMRYVNVTLGVPARPTYAGGVRFDPHGFNGQDNSRYSSGAQDLSFGEGCVDDAEDADVVIHELGHALHDFLGTISNSVADGLSEGLGDYVAASYTRALGLLSPSAPSYDWVFKWDGHNECWNGRTVNPGVTYPGGGARHGVGQNWAAANMRIWNVLGRERTDRAVFEGIRLSNGSSTQPQVANLVMQAAANMGYSASELQTMLQSYQQQGYTGLMMPVAAAGAPGEAAGTVLTAAAPNPFNGRTVFELVPDRDQRVSVEVVDLLGRRVALLFDGPVRAGSRYPFALDAPGLGPGVYVYRAVGETFNLSGRATLVR